MANFTYEYIYVASANASGYDTVIVRMPNVLLNEFTHSLILTSTNSSVFALPSVAVAAASWYHNLQLSIVGYYAGTVIVSVTFTLQVFALSHLVFNEFTIVDVVKFISYGGLRDPSINGSDKHFAMDNMCLNFP
ncbi:unnamed protein product [Rotaria sp. Silwood2]|nr:unnamed protein product [Rotaria sp. Silwood2]CAF2515520.1 unnamed protein product [Rotaria sp. Silwood2]CAF2909064.1 unnamed protein product [Rotaria sp. Silwood2]